MRQTAVPQRVLVEKYVCVGDFTHSAGTVAGCTALRLNVENLNNLGGRFTGHDVGVIDRPPD